ncbi:MAG: glycosyltransferase family 4 protein [Anaerolineales bacterium]|nr:glycosyltransferase family 4 protein [Anaerolineales bacterium]
MKPAAQVAMLIPWADVEGPGGGVGRCAEAVCVALAARGFPIAVLALWQARPASEARLRARLQAAGVPLTTGAPWDPGRPYLSLARAVWSLGRALRPRWLQLVHAHHEFGDLAAAWLKLSGAVPVAARTVHNAEWLWRPLARQLLTDRLYPRVFAAEAGVSREIVQRLDDRPAALRSGHSARLLYNAIDLQRFQGPAPDQAEVRRSLGLPAAGPVIGSVGRLSEQKGYAGLLAAAPAVLRGRPAARLVLVGDGPLEAALRAQAAALGVTDQVVFAGSRPDVERVLSVFDVFVSASLFEGLPTVVLESMAAGVPVVATAVSGSRELVADGRNGLLTPPAAPDELARAINRVLTDPALGAQLAQTARAGLAPYSIDAAAAGYQALWESVLT